MGYLKRQVVDRGGVSDKLAIWQGRQHYFAGTPRCLISLLKPVIGADGMIYPCCGAQYAESVPAKDYPKSMVMGGVEDTNVIWDKQLAFDGSRCVKCYYEHYNSALAALVDDINHMQFV
jgi:hypothetical protein